MTALPVQVKRSGPIRKETLLCRYLQSWLTVAMKCRVMYSYSRQASPPATGEAAQRQAPAPGSPVLPLRHWGPCAQPLEVGDSRPPRGGARRPAPPGLLPQGLPRQRLPPSHPHHHRTPVTARRWSTAFRWPHAAMGPDPAQIGSPARLTLLSCEARCTCACVCARGCDHLGVPPIPNSASVADFMGVMGGWSPASWPFRGRLIPSAKSRFTCGGSRDGAGCQPSMAPSPCREHGCPPWPSMAHRVSPVGVVGLLPQRPLQVEALGVVGGLGARVADVALRVEPLGGLHGVLRAHSCQRRRLSAQTPGAPG